MGARYPTLSRGERVAGAFGSSTVGWDRPLGPVVWSGPSRAGTLGRMIPITPKLTLDEGEIVLSYVRSPGPGGQNVNKLATAAQLRFDAAHSPALDGRTLARLKTLAGRRMTKDGVIVITANRFRSQTQNREDAIARLVDLLRQAATPVAKRVKTRPTRASRERRLTAKRLRADVKRGRGDVPGET